MRVAGRARGYQFPAGLAEDRKASLLIGSEWGSTLEEENPAARVRISVIAPIIWRLRSVTQMPLDSDSLCRYL
jgi:hypothetical protein